MNARRQRDILAAQITRQASKQTYYVFRFLIDHDRSFESCRANKTKDKTGLISSDRACFLFKGSFLDYDKCSYQNLPDLFVMPPS
jgi:hypothetical protein